MTERRHLPDHAPYSPSGMERIIECPLSVQLSKQAPPEPESIYAMEGTTAHNHAEESLLSGEVPLLEDKEMQKGVEVYFNYCDPKVETADNYGVETKVVADEELFGTVDNWVYQAQARMLEIIDFKYGFNPVDPEDNTQLMTYAACLFLDDEIPITEEMVDTIRLTVVQPRGDGISSWDTNTARVSTHLETIDGAINASKMDNPPGAMGHWCKWCPAKIICPILTAAEEGLKTWDSRDLSDEELGQLLLTAQVLEGKAKAIFSYAHARAEDGQRITGWKLVPKRASRKWIDKKKVLAWAKRNGRMKIMMPAQLLSPAQAGKVLGDDFESVAKMIESVSTGTNLKQSNDPAEEVQSLGAAMQLIGNLPKR
jgi:hypothetical protein